MYVIKGMLDNQFYYFVSSITNQESKTTIRQLSTIINDAMVYDTIEDAENIIKNIIKNVIKNNNFKVYPICTNCDMLETSNDLIKIQES